MAHTQREQKKLVDRIRRIRGQLNAVEAALEENVDCSEVLQRLAACRGALNGLFAEVVEDHIRFHLVDPATERSKQKAEAAQELLDVVRTYFK